MPQPPDDADRNPPPLRRDEDASPPPAGRPPLPERGRRGRRGSAHSWKIRPGPITSVAVGAIAIGGGLLAATRAPNLEESAGRMFVFVLFVLIFVVGPAYVVHLLTRGRTFWINFTIWVLLGFIAMGTLAPVADDPTNLTHGKSKAAAWAMIEDFQRRSKALNIRELNGENVEAERNRLVESFAREARRAARDLPHDDAAAMNVIGQTIPEVYVSFLACQNAILAYESTGGVDTTTIDFRADLAHRRELLNTAIARCTNVLASFDDLPDLFRRRLQRAGASPDTQDEVIQGLTSAARLRLQRRVVAEYLDAYQIERKMLALLHEHYDIWEHDPTDDTLYINDDDVLSEYTDLQRRHNAILEKLLATESALYEHVTGRPQPE